MHPTDLPPEIIDRLMQRRGRVHMFDELDPARTALVVVDMQNAFCAEGAPLEVPLSRAIIPSITHMADALRDMGGTVAWVRSHFKPGVRDWHVFLTQLNPPLYSDPVRANMRPGQRGYDLAEGLAVVPGDIEVEKDRFSAFLPGACDLPDRLTERGIDTVLICGTLTNVCCESSARDAMMQNFRVVMLSDANATRTDAEHMATLVNMATTFGDVQTVDEAIGFLRSGAARARGAA